MDKQQKTECSDCGGKLENIKLLAQEAGMWQANILVDYYAESEATPLLGKLGGRIPKAGTVTARRCKDCGRISLFGDPKNV